MTVRAGRLPAESAWADPATVRLPLVAGTSPEDMDHLLAALCTTSDVLATHRPRPEPIVAQHADLGLEPREILLMEGGRGLTDIAEPALQPYAVTPDVLEWAGGCGVAAPLPSVDVAARANSKTWSTELAAGLGAGAGGVVVRSAAELAASVAAVASDRGAVVKEPHGVAGAGSMVLDGEPRVRRLAARLGEQERAGRRVELVLEPLLAVARSFSAQIDLRPDSRWHLAGIQESICRGFAYAGSVAAGQEILARLDDRYFAVVDDVAAALHRIGYFGPVCLDSLLLVDDRVVAIGEINARESMGSINLALDRALEPFGCRSALANIRLSWQAAADAGALVAGLDKDGLLFGPDQRRGVVALALVSAGAGPRRLYLAVPHKAAGPAPAVTLDRVRSAIESSGRQPI
jgi:hypothetical protein